MFVLVLAAPSLVFGCEVVIDDHSQALQTTPVSQLSIAARFRFDGTNEGEPPSPEFLRTAAFYSKYSSFRNQRGPIFGITNGQLFLTVSRDGTAATTQRVLGPRIIAADGTVDAPQATYGATTYFYWDARGEHSSVGVTAKVLPRSSGNQLEVKFWLYEYDFWFDPDWNWYEYEREFRPVTVIVPWPSDTIFIGSAEARRGCVQRSSVDNDLRLSGVVTRATARSVASGHWVGEALNVWSRQLPVRRWVGSLDFDIQWRNSKLNNTFGPPSVGMSRELHNASGDGVEETRRHHVVGLPDRSSPGDLLRSMSWGSSVTVLPGLNLISHFDEAERTPARYEVYAQRAVENSRQEVLLDDFFSFPNQVGSTSELRYLSRVCHQAKAHQRPVVPVVYCGKEVDLNRLKDSLRQYDPSVIVNDQVDALRAVVSGSTRPALAQQYPALPGCIQGVELFTVYEDLVGKPASEITALVQSCVNRIRAFAPADFAVNLGIYYSPTYGSTISPEERLRISAAIAPVTSVSAQSWFMSLSHNWQFFNRLGESPEFMRDPTLLRELYLATSGAAEAG